MAKPKDLLTDAEVPPPRRGRSRKATTDEVKFKDTAKPNITTAQPDPVEEMGPVDIATNTQPEPAKRPQSRPRKVKPGETQGELYQAVENLQIKPTTRQAGSTGLPHQLYHPVEKLSIKPTTTQVDSTKLPHQSYHPIESLSIMPTSMQLGSTKLTQPDSFETKVPEGDQSTKPQSQPKKRPGRPRKAKPTAYKEDQVDTEEYDAAR